MSPWHNPSPFSPSQGGRGRSTATSMCMGPMVSSSIRARRCSSPGGEDTGSRLHGGARSAPSLHVGQHPAYGLLPRDAKGARGPARRGRLSLDEDRLYIDKLLNAIGGEFTTITALFDPAKRQAWIGFHEGVDETTASLQFVG